MANIGAYTCCNTKKTKIRINKNDNSVHIAYFDPTGSSIIYTRWTNDPTLSWTGETNYTTDGLDPEIGTSTTTFVYRVQYTDIDNDAPASDYPKIHIKKAGSEISDSPFTMTAVNTSDVTYTDGKIYAYSTTLPQSASDYAYYFEAYDISGATSTGISTNSVDAPDISPVASTSFIGTAISVSSINWSWNDTVGEEGYKVQDSENLDKSGSLYANMTFWTESNLSPNTQYVRHIYAYVGNAGSNSNSDSKYTLANSPTNLSIGSIFRSSATMSWDNMGATRYKIERVIDSGGSPDVWGLRSGNITGITYTDTGLSGETTYWYRVFSYNGDGVITSTPSSNIICYNYYPKSPSPLSSNAISTTSIMWLWTNNSDIETGYYVRTSTGGTIKTLSANVTYWAETNLQPNIEYTRYAVTYTAVAESEVSNSSSVYTLANAPDNLSCSGTTSSSANLSWTGNGTKYSIERSPNGISWTIIKQWADNITGTTYTDTGLNPHTTYWYRVKAYNNNQIITSPSNEIAVLTLNTSPSKPTNIVPLSDAFLPRETKNPQFSWSLLSDADGDTQSALQVQVRSSLGNYGDSTSKDSNEVVSSANTYAPSNFNLVTVEYYWRVKVKDNSGFDNAWSSWSNETKFSIANSSPTLSWTGETNYVSDGIDPETSDASITYTFRVKYSDADNDVPLNGYPKLHIKKGGAEITGSPFTMVGADIGDTTYTDGKIYL